MPNSDSMLKWSTFFGQKFPWSNILFLPIKNSFRIWESKGQERKEEKRIEKKSNLSWLYCHVYYHRMEFQRHTIQLTSQVTQVKIQVQDFGFLNCEILNITYIVEVENLFFFLFCSMFSCSVFESAPFQCNCSYYQEPISCHDWAYHLQSCHAIVEQCKVYCTWTWVNIKTKQRREQKRENRE